MLDDNKRIKPLILISFLIDRIPFSKYFFGKQMKDIAEIYAYLRGLLKRKYNEHVASYEPGKIRDLCDALIEAKMESESEEKESAKYLVEANLVPMLMDFFMGKAGYTCKHLSEFASLFSGTQHHKEHCRMDHSVDGQLSGNAGKDARRDRRCDR